MGIKKKKSGDIIRFNPLVLSRKKKGAGKKSFFNFFLKTKTKKTCLFKSTVDQNIFRLSYCFIRPGIIIMINFLLFLIRIKAFRNEKKQMWKSVQETMNVKKERLAVIINTI